MRIDTDTGDLDNLIADLKDAAVKLNRALDEAARDTAKGGNRLAVASARQTAGKHGKLYPRAFSVEHVASGVYVYGPVSAMPQGGMSFELGSRNQPPHLDLALSRDYVRDQLPRKVADALARVLW